MTVKTQQNRNASDGLKIHVSPVRSRLCPLPLSDANGHENQAEMPDSGPLHAPSETSPISPELTTGSLTEGGSPCGRHCGPKSWTEAVERGKWLREHGPSAVVGESWREPCGVVTYFVLAEGAAVVKIGRSTDLSSRMDSLNCSSPVQLILLAYLHGDHEETLHSYFAHSRSRYEWFHATPDLIGFILSIEFSDPFSCEMLEKFNAARRGSLASFPLTDANARRPVRGIEAFRSSLPTRKVPASRICFTRTPDRETVEEHLSCGHVLLRQEDEKRPAWRRCPECVSSKSSPTLVPHPREAPPAQKAVQQ